MILYLIEGSGIRKGADPSYLKDQIKPADVSIGSLPRDNYGIVITKCGRHREHLAAADNILVYGECSSAPAGAKRVPADQDINKLLIDEWTSMVETEAEEESETDG